MRNIITCNEYLGGRQSCTIRMLVDGRPFICRFLPAAPILQNGIRNDYEITSSFFFFFLSLALFNRSVLFNSINVFDENLHMLFVEYK